MDVIKKLKEIKTSSHKIEKYNKLWEEVLWSFFDRYVNEDFVSDALFKIFNEAIEYIGNNLNWNEPVLTEDIQRCLLFPIMYIGNTNTEPVTYFHTNNYVIEGSGFINYTLCFKNKNTNQEINFNFNIK